MAYNALLYAIKVIFKYLQTLKTLLSVYKRLCFNGTVLIAVNLFIYVQHQGFITLHNGFYEATGSNFKFAGQRPGRTYGVRSQRFRTAGHNSNLSFPDGVREEHIAYGVRDSVKRDLYQFISGYFSNGCSFSNFSGA